MKKELKLEKGDKVWAQIPINAEIVSVSKKYGYILGELEIDETIAYFSDEEVEFISKSTKS